MYKQETGPTANNAEFETLHGVDTHLADHTEYLIDTDNPLKDEYGYSISAVIYAGFRGEEDEEVRDTYFLIDLRSAPSDSEGRKRFKDITVNPDIEFMLISPDFDDKIKDNKGYKGIRKGEEVIFGRNNKNLSDKFDLDGSIGLSREHFRLALGGDGQMTIQDLSSSNGTSVKAAKELVMNGFRTTSETGHERDSQERNNNEEGGYGNGGAEQDYQDYRAEQASGDAFMDEVDAAVKDYEGLDPGSAAEIIHQIRMIDLENPDEVKGLYRVLMARWHPDRAERGSYDEKVRTAATKFITAYFAPLR